MNLCSEGHDEVCYDGRNCPACSLIDEVTSLKHEIINLEEKQEIENEKS